MFTNAIVTKFRRAAYLRTLNTLDHVPRITVFAVAWKPGYIASQQNSAGKYNVEQSGHVLAVTDS